MQDCMTKLNFWKDDSYVVSLIVEKFWADVPGIYIRVEAIE
ncbi:endodeoxyribonuclease RusA [Enterococcus faecalis]|nr:endodeoxyribonuclease RusA [Enterococcus faecalis]